MEETLLAFLLAYGPLAALVADRISWVWRGGGSGFPAVSLTLTDSPQDVCMDGPSGFVDGFVQVDIWTNSVIEGVMIFRAITAALAGLNEASSGGVIQYARRMHASYEFEGEQPDRIFRTRLSLHVPHTQV